MNSRLLLGLLAVVSTLGFCCQSAEAQPMRRERVPHYQRTATISPYAQLFGRNNGGGITNYFLDVRPQLQFQQQLNRIQQGGFQRQQYQQQMMMQQTQQITQALNDPNGPLVQFTNRGGRRGRVSAAGSFMNTGSFYPQSNMAGQPRARAAGFGR